MLGRHNITVYADELERCIGSCRLLLKREGITDGEYCYWLGVLFTLEQLHGYSMPDDAEQFINVMQLHFGADEKEGEDA